MKKIFSLFLVLVFVLLLISLFFFLASSKKMIVVQEGNSAQLPIEMQVGRFQDSDCGMVIDELKDASQVISKSGKSWFFHDHGGMIKWLEGKEFQESAKIWAMSRDTNEWIDAREAFYSTNDNTPMEYGFGAYKEKSDEYIDFATMRLRVLRGETLRNPLIKKQQLGKE
jgi:hypothetical protein